MEDALVTHDGLHGHTPRKRCISTPTRRRKTWWRLGGAARGLTDVSLCHVCYLHYYNIIIPAPLYLTAPSLFCREVLHGASGVAPPAPLPCSRDRDAKFCFYRSCFLLHCFFLVPLSFSFRRSRSFCMLHVAYVARETRDFVNRSNVIARADRKAIHRAS